MRRSLKVILVILIVALSGWLIYDRWGLMDIPEEPPAERTIGSQPFTDAIAEASELIARHREQIHVPSLSVAVAVDGQIVWAEAIGWADISAGRPATPQTSYRIGSTSKAITVSLTGRLMELGLVELDEPIESYMNDLPEHWRRLTLRQLHSHTAGIVGYEENHDWFGVLDAYLLWSHYDNVADALGQFDGSGLLFEPGTDFHYSSFDVALAAAVLQAVAGEPYLELLQREVLQPAGMQHTGADHNPHHPPHRAVFYGHIDRQVKPWRNVDLSGKLAGGGLASTPSDLVRLGIAWLNGTLFSEEIVQQLWTPQRLASGEVNEQSYALGWRSEQREFDWSDHPLWIVHHGGVSKGSMSWLVIFPDLEIIIALTINARAETFSDFARPFSEIARIFHQARNQVVPSYSDTQTN